MKKRTLLWKKLASLVTALALIIAVLPIAVVVGSSKASAGRRITAFAELTADATIQHVFFGTKEVDLNLPSELAVLVLADVAEGEVAEEAIEQMISVSKWNSEPAYDQDRAGRYEFTPVLVFTDGLAIADGIQLPSIAVVVEPSPEQQLVTAFDELPKDIRWQNTMNPNFPKVLQGTAGGNVIPIPVTWQADHDYYIGNPESGLYVFTAEPDAGYLLADDVQPLRMSVYIPPHLMTRMSGEGTAASPLELTTPAQLAEIAELVNLGELEIFILNDENAKVSLKLMNDLDLAGYSSGEGWIPIGTSSDPFKGNFDGSGYRITAVTINRPDDGYQGLFGSIHQATVERLGVVDVTIRGAFSVGGIAGEIYDSTIRHCFSTGVIIGDASDGEAIGGVAGYARGTSVLEDCYAQSSIIGESNVGGVVGYLDDDSIIRNAYALGSVDGSGNVGGIVGQTYDDAIVEQCFAANRVTGRMVVGGIAGTSFGALRQCAALNIAVEGIGFGLGRVMGATGFYDHYENNVAYSEIPGIWGSDSADDIDGESKTAAQIAAAEFFQVLFGGDLAWTYATGKLPGLFGAVLDIPPYLVDGGNPYFYGNGTIDEPYKIYTAADLAKLAELVNARAVPYADAGKYYQLMNDINLSGYASGAGWIPIGANETELTNDFTQFKGQFDGAGKVISGLRINHATGKYLGLFGYIGSGGMVQNLGVTDIDMIGDSLIGGVAGYVKNGTIQNCYVSGSIVSVGRVGGIAGIIDAGSMMQNCYSSVDVSGSNNVIGGIAGVVNGTLQNCYSTGHVSGTGPTFFGGITGYVNGTVRNSVAMNPGVTGNLFVGRVAGGNGLTFNLSANYAFAGMPGAWNTIGANQLNGANLSIAQIYYSDFWRTSANWDAIGWDEGIWILEDGKLPTLKEVGGMQSGDGGIHLAKQDIAHATASATGTYTYTGSIITPTVNVIYNNETLVQDIDYRISSSSINAGAATATISGKGSFTGSMDVAFAIEKAEQSTPAVTGTSDVNGAVYHYTIDMLENAEYRMDGEEWQSNNEFINIAPNSSHIFYARLKETANYAQSAAGSTGIIAFAKLQDRPTPALQYSISESDFPKTVTITPIAGAEYQFNSGGYSSVNTYFSNSAENVTLHIRLAETSTYAATPAASVVINTANQEQVAPSAFTVSYQSVNNTSYTVTIPATEGAEYSFDGVTWSNVNSKAGCLPGPITVYKRIAAKPGYHASSATSSSTTLPPFPKSSRPRTEGSIAAPVTLPNQPVVGTVVVAAAADSKKAAHVQIADQIILDAIANAKAAAKMQNKSLNGIAIEAAITLPKDSAALSVSLSSAVLQSLVQENVRFFTMKSTTLPSVSFDLKVLQELQKQSSGIVTVSITPVNHSSAAAKQMIQARPLYDITVHYQKDGKKHTISALHGGIVTIAIPYKVADAKAAGYLFGVYVDEKGNASRIVGSVYDANAEAVLIPTGHLSIYGVGYLALTTQFADIIGHWNKEAMDYVAGRGLLSGSAAAIFAPNTAVTRKEVVMALGKLAGIDTKLYAGNRCLDEKIESVFRPYLEWASQNSIILNTKDHQCFPDRTITREEIAVLFEQFAKVISYPLPITREAISYADASGIDSRSLQAVKMLQQAGLMMDRSDRKFAFKAALNRTEFSSLLHRYSKLRVNPATAQGWAKNDSGQIYYYQNGKLLTGWQTIHQKRYYFSANGIMTASRWLELDHIWYYFKADGTLA